MRPMRPVPPKLKTIIPKFLMLALLGTLMGCGIKTNNALNSINEKISDTLVKDAATTEALFVIEKKAATGSAEQSMNVKQLYKLYEQSINQRTTMIVELRGFQSETQYELRNQVADYLNNENSVLSAKRRLFENYLTFTNEEFEALKEKVQLAKTIEHRRRIYANYLNSASDLAKEADSLITNYKSLVEQESILLGKLSEAKIKFNPVFSTYQDINITNFKSKKDAASGIAEELLSQIKRMG